MLQSVLVTAEQTAILFVLMTFGVLARRLGMLDAANVKMLTSLVVNFTTPCIIISAFQCPFEPAKLPGLLWSALLAAIWYALGIAAERFCIRGGEELRRKCLKWAVIFSNCGFMGLPLEYALFGSDGVFYGVMPIAIFNFLAWTYGVSLFRPIKGGEDLLRGVLNPANVASVMAVILFFLPWRLPEIVAAPVRLVGEMNTPLPMLILGYCLGGAKFSQVFRCGQSYIALSLRHFIIPMLFVGALMLFPALPLDLKLMAVVPAAAPTGVLLTVFAITFDADAEYSTAFVAVSTVLSIITIPLVIGLAGTLLTR